MEPPLAAPLLPPILTVNVSCVLVPRGQILLGWGRSLALSVGTASALLGFPFGPRGFRAVVTQSGSPFCPHVLTSS